VQVAILRPESGSRERRRSETNVFAEADGVIGKRCGTGDSGEESRQGGFGGSGGFTGWGIQSVENEAPKKLGEEVSHDLGMIKYIDAGNGAGDGKRDAALALLPVENAGEFVERGGVAGIDFGDGARGRLGIEARKFRGDFIPDCLLNGETRASSTHGVSDLREALSAGGAIVEMVGGFELGRSHAPAAGFDTRDGDGALEVCGNEDREIEDAILLGAEEFFAVDEEDGKGGIVGDEQLRDGAGGVELGNVDEILGDAVIEEEIVASRKGGGAAEKREKGEIAEVLVLAKFDLKEFFTKGKHEEAS